MHGSAEYNIAEEQFAYVSCKAYDHANLNPLAHMVRTGLRLMRVMSLHSFALVLAVAARCQAVVRSGSTCFR